MANAERDWNKFRKKVIDQIKKDNVLGNANYGLEDFSTYYHKDANGNDAG